MRSQGRFGANYSVNGHRTSGERRVDFNKGYSFLFERCFEEMRPELSHGHICQ